MARMYVCDDPRATGKVVSVAEWPGEPQGVVKLRLGARIQRVGKRCFAYVAEVVRDEVPAVAAA